MSIVLCRSMVLLWCQVRSLDLPRLPPVNSLIQNREVNISRFILAKFYFRILVQNQCYLFSCFICMFSDFVAYICSLFFALFVL